MKPASPLVHRVAAAAYFFVCGFIFASWAVRIPSVKARFHFNDAQLGAILFLLPFGSLLALPFAGWVVNKAGSRVSLVVSTVVYAALLLAIGFSYAPWALGLCLFIFGFCGDTLNIAMNTQALQVQTQYYGKPLMSSFHGMWSFGALSGASVGGWIIHAGWSLPAHYWFVFAWAGVLAVSAYFFLVAGERPAEEQKIFAWPDRALWLLGAICFCCTLCEGAMSDWSSLFFQKVSGNLQSGTTGYTAYALMMALGRMVGDAVTGRLGYKGILLLDSLLIASGLGIAIGFATPGAVMAGFGMVGLGVATIIPIVYTLASKNTSMATSAALAAVSTVGFSGFLVGPPVIGFIAQATGLRWALLLVLLLAMGILILSRRVRT